MYSEYETPQFAASLFYFDYQYAKETSADVEEILKEYGFFPPDKIHAYRLTGNRFRRFSSLKEDVFVKAYAEPDVSGLSMASGDSRKVADFWTFVWDFTFYKFTDVDVSKTVFKPWNILTLESTYGRLNNEANRQAFLQCVRRLIQYIQPFYGRLDDIDTIAELDGKPFRPEEKRPVFWGNYWGSEYCKMVGAERLGDLAEISFSRMNDGLFFTLTDNILDCRERICAKRRKMVEKELI